MVKQPASNQMPNEEREPMPETRSESRDNQGNGTLYIIFSECRPLCSWLTAGQTQTPLPPFTCQVSAVFKCQCSWAWAFHLLNRDRMSLSKEKLSRYFCMRFNLQKKWQLSQQIYNKYVTSSCFLSDSSWAFSLSFLRRERSFFNMSASLRLRWRRSLSCLIRAS